MNKLMALVMCLLFFGVGMMSISYSAVETESPTPRLVQGKLLKIDGAFYVVKDQRESGKEIRLHVDDTTKRKGSLEPGKTIKAEATEKNHAIWIEPVK